MTTQNVQHLVTSKTVIPIDTPSGFKIAWSPDGKFFAVNGPPLQVTVYEAANQNLVQVLHYKQKIFGSSFGNLAWSPDGKYLAGGMGVITLWDTKTWQPIRDIEGPYTRGLYVSSGVNTFAFSPDSKTLVAHYEEVLLPENLKPTTRAEHEQLVRSHTATFASFIKGFEVDTARQIFSVKIEKNQDLVRQLSGNIVFMPDGKNFLTARKEFATNARQKITGERHQYHTFIDFRDVHTGQIVKSVSPVHVMRITALAVSPDGRFIASGTNTLSRESQRNPVTDQWQDIDNQDPLRLWNADSGQLVREFGPLRGAVRALSFSPNGKYLVSCQTDIKERQTLWLWNIESGQLIERVSTPNSGSEFFDCAFSPDGRYVAMPVINQIYLIGIRP